MAPGLFPDIVLKIAEQDRSRQYPIVLSYFIN